MKVPVPATKLPKVPLVVANVVTAASGDANTYGDTKSSLPFLNPKLIGLKNSIIEPVEKTSLVVNVGIIAVVALRLVTVSLFTTKLFISAVPVTVILSNVGELPDDNVELNTLLRFKKNVIICLHKLSGFSAKLSEGKYNDNY